MKRERGEGVGHLDSRRDSGGLLLQVSRVIFLFLIGRGKATAVGDEEGVDWSRSRWDWEQRSTNERLQDVDTVGPEGVARRGRRRHDIGGVGARAGTDEVAVPPPRTMNVRAAVPAVVVVVVERDREVFEDGPRLDATQLDINDLGGRQTKDAAVRCSVVALDTDEGSHRRVVTGGERVLVDAA